MSIEPSAAQWGILLRHYHTPHCCDAFANLIPLIEAGLLTKDGETLTTRGEQMARDLDDRATKGDYSSLTEPQLDALYRARRFDDKTLTHIILDTSLETPLRVWALEHVDTRQLDDETLSSIAHDPDPRIRATLVNVYDLSDKTMRDLYKDETDPDVLNRLLEYGMFDDERLVDLCGHPDATVRRKALNRIRNPRQRQEQARIMLDDPDRTVFADAIVQADTPLTAEQTERAVNDPDVAHTLASYGIGLTDDTIDRLSDDPRAAYCLRQRMGEYRKAWTQVHYHQPMFADPDTSKYATKERDQARLDAERRHQATLTWGVE